MPPDVRRVITGRAIRGFADGFVSVLLAQYLSGLGFSPVEVGAIVTGISFLGAGMIIFRRDSSNVSGLTTSAGILTTAVIGMLVGLERYFLALGSTAIVFVVLRFVNVFELRYLDPKTRGKKSNKEED